MAKIGIIGGSGLENPDILKSPREHNPDTPYGKPSSPLLCGSLNGTEIVILSRHGRHHTIPPSKVNNQANIFALKATGCTHILATTACGSLGLKIHESGTLITIEGPRFSTRAESKMFRIWGADVINMSVAPEVTLANELGIPYAAIAMSTDYDCWKDDEESVSWEAVIAVFNSNVSKVLRLLHEVIPAIK
ncbi:MAG: MTAP family purine nucleoside phosphorylase [Bacteroidales bacterium]|nr:MTAP family purine nucleoside phosphorylase [Bacteroidales bacterium]